MDFSFYFILNYLDKYSDKHKKKTNKSVLVEIHLLLKHNYMHSFFFSSEFSVNPIVSHSTSDSPTGFVHLRRSIQHADSERNMS